MSAAGMLAGVFWPCLASAQLAPAPAPVQSVAGRTGAVTDLSAGTVSGTPLTTIAAEAAGAMPKTGGQFSGQTTVNLGISNGASIGFGSYATLKGALDSGNNFASNYMQITSDALAYGGANYVSTLHLDHNFGGGGMTGSRAGLDVSMIMRGTSSNTGNRTQYYVGIADYVQCGYNDNGAAGFASAAGSCVAFNPIASLSGSYFYTLNAEEIDTITTTGGSSAHTFGTLNVKSGVGPRGTYDDAALAFASGSSNPSWAFLIQVGKTDGKPPTGSDTTLLGCVSALSGGAPCPLGNGIDLRNFAISGNAFASPGFVVDGSGNLTANSYVTSALNGPTAGVSAITFTNTGTYATIPSVTVGTPPAGGVQATASVVTMSLAQWVMQTGGSGYSLNDVLTLSGGVFTTPASLKVTSVDARGAITTISSVSAGVYSALPGATVSTTGGTGTGASFAPRFYINMVSITNPGSGYQSPPSVSFSTSPYGTAAAHTTLGASQPITLSAAAGVTIATGPLRKSVTTGISATGSTQGGATPLISDVNVLSTVGSGAGVTLSAAPGAEQEVINRGANAVAVYPPSGATIDGGAVNAGVSVAAGGKARFVCATSISCYTE